MSCVYQSKYQSNSARVLRLPPIAWSSPSFVFDSVAKCPLFLGSGCPRGARVLSTFSNTTEPTRTPACRQLHAQAVFPRQPGTRQRTRTMRKASAITQAPPQGVSSVLIHQHHSQTLELENPSRKNHPESDNVRPTGPTPPQSATTEFGPGTIRMCYPDLSSPYRAGQPVPAAGNPKGTYHQSPGPKRQIPGWSQATHFQGPRQDAERANQVKGPRQASVEQGVKEAKPTGPYPLPPSQQLANGSATMDLQLPKVDTHGNFNH